MKLERVRIERLRSVLQAEIPSVGRFNVLIGKNNSGKSTLLSAIQTFYRSLAEGEVVALHPPMGDVIDFTDKESRNPIEIELQFSVTLAERDELVRNIALEAPQLKNAVDGLDPNLRLSAAVRIARAPSPLAYVGNLAFVSPKGTEAPRTILSVGAASAAELQARASNLERAKANSRAITDLVKRIDEDDWKRLRDGGGSGSQVPRSFFLRRLGAGDLSGAIEQLLDSLIRDSGNFSEFKRGLKSSSERLMEDARAQLAQPLRNPLQTFSGEETSVPPYVLKCLGLIAETRVLYLSERRKPLGKEEAQRLLALKVRRGGNEALKNIQQTVHALLGVHIDAFESASSVGAEKPAEMDVDDFLLEVNGAGIREALRLILDVEFERPTILLVEEPEVHLHPALELAMMRYLKQVSEGAQVFVSTHSTNFLDAGDFRNVYLVSKDKYTNVQLLDLEDAQSSIPKELGLRLSSLFMFDRLVFVEGASDEAVLREHANVLDVNLAQRNVGFIRMGGVRNFTHYASEAIMSFLSNRRVEIHFLVDRDEQNAEEIAAIKSRLAERATVHVLAKREIENYLLQPRAIVAFLVKKTQSAPAFDTALTEDRVRELLVQAADELREFTIAKRMAKRLCRPIFAKHAYVNKIAAHGARTAIESEIGEQLAEVEARRSEMAEVHARESASLGAQWDENKFDLVPGSELLDKVFQRYGVRFRKETDSARIAAEIDRGEISDELVTFIKSVGR